MNDPIGPPIVPHSFLANRAEAEQAIADKAALLGQQFTGPEESDLQQVPGIVGERFLRRYAKCTIYWVKDHGAHEIHGPIRELFDTPLAGSVSAASVGLIILGPPVTDQMDCPDGKGRFNHFQQNGSIFWHPDAGPFRVLDGIREVWRGTGAEQGHLGYPIENQHKESGGNNVQSCLFMNGALSSEDGQATDAAEVRIKPDDLLTIIWRSFDEEIHKSPDNVGLHPEKSLDAVSGYALGTTRARNRVLTVTINGFHDAGLLPDEEWSAHMQLRLFSDAHPGSSSLLRFDGHDLFAELINISVTADGGLGTEKVKDGVSRAISAASNSRNASRY
ncbi:MAG TPA: hypothetical protein VFV02_12770 [Acidimicrobiales bacterium]|nr:hypothetical protein [Acidimicrobiales bacterium]